MSREYPWNYRVVIPQETVDRLAEESGWGSEEYPFDALDAVTYAVEECMTPCHHGIGVGWISKNPYVDYMFNANKAKAKFLKEKLDDFLNGEVLEFSKVDEQWWEDHKDE